MGKQSLLGYIMGTNHSKDSNSHHNEAKLAAQKFDTDEIHVLRKTWQDLADRSNGKGIDKETFLQYFPLNGLLGERLFAQFDTKKTASIDFDDFISGLATVCRGSMDEKIHFVFNMYDVSHDNTVSKQDLTTLLNQIPKAHLGNSSDHGGDYYHHGQQQAPYSPAPSDFTLTRQRSLSGSSTSMSEQEEPTGVAGAAPHMLHAHSREQSREIKPDAASATPASAGAAAGGGQFGNAPGIGERDASSAAPAGAHPLGITREGSTSAVNTAGLPGTITDFDYEDVDFYTNHDMVEKAFAECDLNHDGRLSYEQFKMWVQRTPTIMEYIESILPYNGPKDLHAHHDKKESLPHLKRIASRMSMGRGKTVDELAGEVFNHSTSTHGGLPSSRNSRALSMRLGGGTPRGHSMSMQHLTLNLNNVQGSGPHSPMVPTPHGNGNGNGNGPPSAPPPGALSRNSSFGFPTPSNAAGAAGGGYAENRFSLDVNSAHGSVAGHTAAAAGTVACMPGEYNLNNHHNPRQMASPSVCHDNGLNEYDSEEMARLYLIHAMEVTQNDSLRLAINALLEETPGGGVISVDRNDSAEVYRRVVSLEAYLWKKGKSMFHMLSKRYYLLSGNCMYYYTHKNDVRPKGVIFLTGFIIERLKEEEMALKGYYGFEIMHQDLSSAAGAEHHRHEKRVLYCKSEDERDKWVSALQHAAHVVPIEDDYVIGKELGRGRFSIVCECVHKMSGIHCAVKIIDKATIEPEEKGLLRTEIAVLKLVNHPNIIRMEGLYESKQHIYIVMEMLKGGELFERIVGRPRFSELEAAKLIRPLLESVAYLHDLGIVHRDLKPENILCGEELEDLKIADFGLSKMVLPKEKMDSACGTLSYVAPEVLTMQGYGREADLWSVGVIMFLLLCGKLPFDGEDHNEIIRSTIQADLKVNPAVWGKLTDEAKGLMTALLNKNPKDRISARDALRHPYILLYSPHIKRSHIPSFGGSEPLVRSSSRDSLSNMSTHGNAPSSAGLPIYSTAPPSAPAAAPAPASAATTTLAAAAAVASTSGKDGSYHYNVGQNPPPAAAAAAPAAAASASAGIADL